MRVFRHGDIISSEIPSDWVDLLGVSNLDSRMTKKIKPQIEFDFMEKASEEMVQLRNGAEQYLEEIIVIIEVAREVFGNSLEE